MDDGYMGGRSISSGGDVWGVCGTGVCEMEGVIWVGFSCRGRHSGLRGDSTPSTPSTLFLILSSQIRTGTGYYFKNVIAFEALNTSPELLEIQINACFKDRTGFFSPSRF